MRKNIIESHLRRKCDSWDHPSDIPCFRTGDFYRTWANAYSSSAIPAIGNKMRDILNFFQKLLSRTIAVDDECSSWSAEHYVTYINAEITVVSAQQVVFSLPIFTISWIWNHRYINRQNILLLVGYETSHGFTFPRDLSQSKTEVQPQLQPPPDSPKVESALFSGIITDGSNCIDAADRSPNV